MAWSSLKVRPGIDVEPTPTLNEAGFSYSQWIRWRAGLPEKRGGWEHLNDELLIGTARGLHAWADLETVPYLVAGTEQRLQLFTGGTIQDITPFRTTSDFAPKFSTTNGSASVRIKDLAHDASAGDWINIIVSISVGGIILLGFYRIDSIVDVDRYDITAADNATATVADGGAVPAFTTTMGSPDISVLFEDHGLAVDDLFEVQVETTVGGITIDAYSVNVVTAVADVDHFTIAPGAAAGSTQTVSENAGEARIGYLIATGYASNTPLGGYGIGDYGAGDYGITAEGAATIIAYLRQWFLDNFGEVMTANYAGSPIYLWFPPATPGNIAVALDATNFPAGVGLPLKVNVSFVAAQAQMIVALGVNPVGFTDLDPLLVRWCTAGNFLQWYPGVTNLAGSYRIPTGSRIVGGLPVGLGNLIWTDVDLYSMTFIGAASANSVFGFNRITSAHGLLASRAAIEIGGSVYWASTAGFCVYGGNGVTPLPCPVWDRFWQNLDRSQVEKVFVASNSVGDELTWWFPRADSGAGEVDAYVTLNLREGSWDYGVDIARTSWIDVNVFGNPIGTDTQGYLQQHEGSYNADGAALPCSIQTGFFAINEGSLFTFVNRIIMDMKVLGDNPKVKITVLAQDFPGGPIQSYGPFGWNGTDSTPFMMVPRARGRGFAIKIESVAKNVWWRMGNIRLLTQPAGKR